jgi:hypothetical protein
MQRKTTYLAIALFAVVALFAGFHLGAGSISANELTPTQDVDIASLATTVNVETGVSGNTATVWVEVNGCRTATTTVYVNLYGPGYYLNCVSFSTGVQNGYTFYGLPRGVYTAIVYACGGRGSDGFRVY